jgi:DNA invertase Pin-like site-specific DNA recombinase
MTDMKSATFSFRKVKTSPEVGEAPRVDIRSNILPFYTKEQQERGPDEPDGFTACYERLSQEDKREGESNSIANQKKILERYCKERGYTPFRHYDEDDGYSGTNFNRPGFQRMLDDIKAGKIVRVVVKDMSRFGRDYLQVGMYTDVLFPELGVHFIAIGDGVDSKRGENEFTAIRNVFNEMFARDTSKKIRATWQSKGKSGEHICVRPPYGYMKDPDDKKKWIVDEEAAAVVQKIFSLCVGGMGPTRIANWLREQRIPCPTAHHVSQGRKAPSPIPKDPCRWRTFAVASILDRLEYLGHTVNFKTSKQSYKNKKVTYNSPDEWMIFENTQEPIIEESVFMIVQNIRQGRVRKTKKGEPSIFSGLLFCADCGGKMYYHRKQSMEAGQERFICSKYQIDRECTIHYIRLDAIEKIVLHNLREAISYVSRCEAKFIREASNGSDKERDRELSKKKNSLAQAEKRITEIDTVIKRLYEDNVSGKLTDERFIKMSRDYEREQSDLKNIAEVTRRELKEHKRKRSNANEFIAVVKKYTDIKELNAAVLREFIEKIYVSERDKATKEQKIQIVYNFVGAFDFQSATDQSQKAQSMTKTNIA